MTGVYWYIWFLGPCWQFSCFRESFYNWKNMSQCWAVFTATESNCDIFSHCDRLIWEQLVSQNSCISFSSVFPNQKSNLEVLKIVHCSTAFGLVTNLSDVISWAIFGWKTNKRGERTQPWETRGKTSSAFSLSPVETLLLWGRTQSGWGHERRLTSSHFARGKVFKSASNKSKSIHYENQSELVLNLWDEWNLEI